MGAPKVSITVPVLVGNNSGQRDQYEEYEAQYGVTKMTDGRVALQRTGGAGPRKIVVDFEAIEKALEIQEQLR